MPQNGQKAAAEMKEKVGTWANFNFFGCKTHHRLCWRILLQQQIPDRRASVWCDNNVKNVQVSPFSRAPGEVMSSETSDT